LECALCAAEREFNLCKKTPALERYRMMRKEAEIMGSHADFGEVVRIRRIKASPLTCRQLCRAPRITRPDGAKGVLCVFVVAASH